MKYLQVTNNIFVEIDDRPEREENIGIDDCIDLHNALYSNDTITVSEFIDQLNN